MYVYDIRNIEMLLHIFVQIKNFLSLYLAIYSLILNLY